MAGRRKFAVPENGSDGDVDESDSYENEGDESKDAAPKKRLGTSRSFFSSRMYLKEMDGDLKRAIQNALPFEVRDILARGAKVNSQFGPAKKTGLMLALDSFDAKHSLSMLTIIDLLLRREPDLHLRNTEGRSVLQEAVLKLNPSVVKLILDKGKNLNLTLVNEALDLLKELRTTVKDLTPVIQVLDEIERLLSNFVSELPSISVPTLGRSEQTS